MGRETASVNASGLIVKSVSPVDAENSRRQYTDEYESDALIVRRGSSFYLDIFHEGFDEENDEFSFYLKAGRYPKKRDGSLVEIKKGAPSKGEYSFQITKKSAESLRVSIALPADTLIACFTLYVSSVQKKNKKKQKVEFEFPKAMFVLFNPWCEDDEVYMENDELKMEYVLNDSGWIYWGGQRPKPWYFGQFTKAALECTFRLLENIAPTKRNNAREICRHISARCNSLDNDGLLAGNWSGDYSGGTKPWVWSGSVAIFKKYLETNKSVEYGQCWVFSGLTTSMMRCLGVPTRSVTNYDSAHDTDNNCTFDKYLDEDFNYLEDESDDSCWNFHVWNDVWMERPDLPAGMGGWQAIDGTPQEESRGVYRCGPASLQSVKEGHVNHSYDAKFVFAEVNADQVYWKRNSSEDGETWLPVRVKTDSVGTAILTKAPNRYKRENITLQYKYEEGSMLERASVKHALKKVKNPVLSNEVTDVTFSSKVPWNVSTETPIKLKINARNKIAKKFTLYTAVDAHVVRYNGVKLKTLEKRKEQQTLEPNKSSTFEFVYDASEYVDYLDENISIRFMLTTKVEGSEQLLYVSQKICNINKPELKCEAIDSKSGKVKSQESQQVKAKDTVQVRISIPSIYGIETYTNCSLDIECPIVDDLTMELDDMAADGSAVIEKTFTIKNLMKKKESELVATFNSKEISGIHGSLLFTVNPK